MPRLALPIALTIAVVASSPLIAQQESTGEPLENLKQQLVKVTKELEFAKQLEAQGGLIPRLKRSIAARNPSPRTIDTGVVAPPLPPQSPDSAVTEVAPQPTRSRLLGDAEKAKLGADVVFTVDGEPVTESEFEEYFDYLRSYPRPDDEQSIKRQAITALVTLKAAAAKFKTTGVAARQKIEEIKKKLDGGQDFAQVATELSDCPSRAQGGDLGFFGRNQGYDTSFERISFSLKVGDVSGIVRSPFGYHIIKVTGREKGDDAAGDRVRASHILALYDTDQQRVRQVMMDAQYGKSDLAFVNDEWRKLAPERY